MGDCIEVSASFVRPGRVGGVEQALYGYIDGLITACPRGVSVRVLSQQSLQLTGRAAAAQVITYKGRFANRFLWDTFDLPALTRAGSTLFFPNYFTPPTSGGHRKITTINDLQYLHLPENFSVRKRLWLKAAIKGTLRSADAVLAISEFVRDDLLDHFGKQFEDRIFVCPTPIIWSSFAASAGRRPRSVADLDGRPFVLSISAEWPHKNIQTLLRAFARIAPIRPELVLILVGQSSSSLPGMLHRGRPLRELVYELGLESRVIQTGYIEEAEIAWLYRNTILFVFPSIFEGHGRPATEAIGLGVPVLTTRRTAIPEATGEAATYLSDPFSVDEMYERMQQMIDSPTNYSPSQVAIERVRDRFSSETIGRRLAALMLG